ncbi:MAG: hypothetical protein H0X29_06015 [Parachlamydiaceae bacterium]|nr:hypothetical protein [Parachlamydiaceae bacterium]
MSKFSAGLVATGIISVFAVVAFLTIDKSADPSSELAKVNGLVAHGDHHHGHHGHHHSHYNHHDHNNNNGNGWNHNDHKGGWDKGYWNGGGVWGKNPGYYNDPNYYYNANGKPSVPYVTPTISAPVVVPK